MAKFKEGDLVVCINDDCHCEPILGRVCTVCKVIDYDGTYSVICDTAEGCSNPSNWLVSEYQLKLYTPQPTVQECLTDPDIDYEKVSENPIYFEFVDIGKALNKLKDYEHNRIVNPTYNTPIDMEFHKGDTVFFISDLKTICCGLVYSVNIGSVCVEFPTSTSVYPIHKCFKTYQEAVNALTAF